jgi:hypothetical protein
LGYRDLYCQQNQQAYGPTNDKKEPTRPQQMSQLLSIVTHTYIPDTSLKVHIHINLISLSKQQTSNVKPVIQMPCAGDDGFRFQVCSIFIKKFWAELITNFPLIQHGPHRK